jgi:hypothetical protein
MTFTEIITSTKLLDVSLAINIFAAALQLALQIKANDRNV